MVGYPTLKRFVLKMAKPKTLSWHIKKTWTECSKYVRLLHSFNGFCTCYTCGVTKPIKEIQAGHGFAGRRHAYLFELDIIRPQCYGCNCCNSGKLDVFTYKLRKEHGTKKFERLWALTNQQRKYSIPELIELREWFKNKIKEE